MSRDKISEEFRFLTNRLEALLLQAPDIKNTVNLRPASDALIDIASRWNNRNRRKEEKP